MTRCAAAGNSASAAIAAAAPRSSSFAPATTNTVAAPLTPWRSSTAARRSRSAGLNASPSTGG